MTLKSFHDDDIESISQILKRNFILILLLINKAFQRELELKNVKWVVLGKPFTRFRTKVVGTRSLTDNIMHGT